MEAILISITEVVSLVAQTGASLIIGIALIEILVVFVQSVFIQRRDMQMGRMRLQFGQKLAIALELLLGADILATAIAPTWNDIGLLAAIAVLRTGMNFFLSRELKET